MSKLAMMFTHSKTEGRINPAGGEMREGAGDWSMRSHFTDRAEGAVKFDMNVRLKHSNEDTYE